jgi:hypothetical protein
MNTLGLPVNPLQQMRHLSGVVSNEAISMAGITNSLRNFIPDVSKYFHSLAHGFVGAVSDEKAVQLTADEKDFLKQLDGRIYLNLVPLAAHVPEGLISTYVEYLYELRASLKHSKEVSLPALSEYSVFLAKIITNREMRTDGLSKKAEYKKMEQVRESLVQMSGACFKPGSSIAVTTYGKVVARNADWSDVFSLLHEVDNLANSIDRAQLHKLAQECARQLDVIVQAVKADKFEDASPEVLVTLADGAYQCGAELEFFALTYFRTIQINTAVSDTMRSITAIFNQK